ncbi:MAG: DUF3597 domain-containing protein [Anaerolineales bacterium]|nr:DUF3597 domain-containing protein [Anaerolineales bacterium]MBK8822811.1 DUF3597 domain-containing protein [Anaerolineales bacterium]
MGFFSNILEKLGLKKDKAETAAAPATPAAAKPAATVKPMTVAPAAKPKTPVEKEDFDSIRTAEAAKPVVAAVSEVDVLAKLEKLSAGSDYNWKVSIVDLLKVLDIDSSREARNELAKELGCPEDLMSDSAKMNVWLHKEVLKQIAANGGNIPQSLLD